MAKPEWGTKRTCQSCGVPFYDLKKKNIECPKCGAAFNPNPPAKPKRPTPTPSTPKPEEEKPPVPAEGESKPSLPDKGDDGGDSVKISAPDVSDDGEVDGLEVDGELDGVDEETGDDEDSLIEDTSDLGTEDDDMSEVKEHIDDGVEDKN